MGGSFCLRKLFLVPFALLEQIDEMLVWTLIFLFKTENTFLSVLVHLAIDGLKVLHIPKK